MIQESPAFISINANSAIQNIRCTLRCGKFHHQMTVVGHFKYVQPVNKANWKRIDTKEITEIQKDTVGSVLAFLIGHWKETVFGVVALVGSLILLWFLK